MSSKSIAIWIFLLSLWAFIWPSPQWAYNPQSLTRMALSISMLEGTLNIDKFAPHTIDKAAYDGHFYADKTPGHSILALPALGLTELIFKLTGQRGFVGLQPPILPYLDDGSFDALAVILTILTNGVISALAASAMFLLAIKLGASRQGAVFANFALILGTPFFGWSTTFFAHSVSGSLLILSLALIVFILQPEKPKIWWQVFALGILMSFTAVVDLTAVPTLILLGLFMLLRGWRQRETIRPIAVVALILGAITGALPLALYNYLAFGSAFSLGYTHVLGFEGMQQGFLGIRLPDFRVMAEILFGGFRGLLPLSPVLALIPVGLIMMARQADTRALSVLIALSMLSYILVNSGYFYWDGGWSTGPRHLVPMLPLACLTLAFMWPKTANERILPIGLLLVSIVISVICALGTIEVDDKVATPFIDLILPLYLQPSSFIRTGFVLVSILGFIKLMTSANQHGGDRI